MLKSVFSLCSAGLILALLLVSGCARHKEETILSHRQAVYENQPPDVNPLVQGKLEVVPVSFFDEKGRLSKGQIVVHKALVQGLLYGLFPGIVALVFIKTNMNV